MKADYKNWMPKGMVASFTGGAAGVWAAALGAHILMPEGTVKRVMTGLSATAGIVLSGVSGWSYLMYRAFDYNGKRQMSRQIITGIAGYVDLPEDGNCLDVGCGSGALAIAIAKRNPKAHVTGIDRWGKEYASFNKELCESNARAEGVSNILFQQGDATHLDFPDETFNAVASNYVYHNIPSKDRQAILLETLRTLKSSRRILVFSNMSQPAGSSACFFILCSQGIFHMSVQGVQSPLPFSYSAGLRGRSYTGTADIDSCA